jgi:ABC-type bacteriocin/lantibiotic exporter with double-glycine peptidase domain
MGNDEVNLEEVRQLAAITGLQSFVESCKEGYDTVLQPVGNKLSNAVRRNILLLRPLLGRNRLLLLEEPFEHLTATARVNLIEYMRLHKKATILVASADRSLESVCDQVIDLTTNGYINDITNRELA